MQRDEFPEGFPATADAVGAWREAWEREDISAVLLWELVATAAFVAESNQPIHNTILMRTEDIEGLFP